MDKSFLAQAGARCKALVSHCPDHAQRYVGEPHAFRSVCLPIAAALFFLFPMEGQAQQVSRVTPDVATGFGITYSLPQTAIRVTARAVKVATQAGTYAPYAEKYLGLTDVAQTDDETWSMESITLEPIGLPDTSRVYHIQFSSKGYLPSFWLTDDGLLTAVGREPAERISAGRHANEKNQAETAGIGRPGDEEGRTSSLHLKATDVLSEDILKASTSAKQAELVAREIFSIRESRRDLLKGDVDVMPADGASMQLMIDHLSAQEQALMSLFEGVRTVERSERTFVYVPEAQAEHTSAAVLFRFSLHFGWVDVDDLSGEPYTLRVTITDDQRGQQVPTEAATRFRRSASSGLAYLIPGKAEVICSGRDIEGCRAEYRIGQFGRVAQLPADIFTDRKKPASAEFNPITGSIRMVEQTAAEQGTRSDLTESK